MNGSEAICVRAHVRSTLALGRAAAALMRVCRFVVQGMKAQGFASRAVQRPARLSLRVRAEGEGEKAIAKV